MSSGTLLKLTTFIFQNLDNGKRGPLTFYFVKAVKVCVSIPFKKLYMTIQNYVKLTLTLIH